MVQKEGGCDGTEGGREGVMAQKEGGVMTQKEGGCDGTEGGKV